MNERLFLFFSNIGYFGPNNLFLLTIYILLRNHKYNVKLMFLFLIIICWLLFSVFLVEQLKKIIKQPRPNQKKYLNNMDKKHGQQYGMPSGHAQLVSNIGTFIILYFQNFYINIVVLTQIFITCWQRWYFKMHTIPQLLVGCLIGSFLGYGLYKIVYKYKKKKS